MNKIRERLLADVNESVSNYPISEHRDLIAFCVCGDYFRYMDDDEYSPDFNEIIVVVDKNWLFEYMEKQDSIKNPRDFLINDYTSDDSDVWFNEANLAGMIAMIDFN